MRNTTKEIMMQNIKNGHQMIDINDIVQTPWDKESNMRYMRHWHRASIMTIIKFFGFFGNVQCEKRKEHRKWKLFLLGQRECHVQPTKMG